MKASLHLPDILRFPLLTATLLLIGAPAAQPASVEPHTGYFSTFDVQPPAEDWATVSRPGAAADNYDLDAEVNTNSLLNALTLTTPTTLDAGNPPPKIATAVWSSTGFYLQTRPTGNRWTALMGKFVNHTGTNATEVGISYTFTIAAGGVAEDAGKGTHAYYSVTGVPGSWATLPSLFNGASANASSTLSTNLPLAWTNGESLYLLWVDDNANALGDDSANQIDNFSLQVTAGTPVSTALTSTLVAPVNNAVLVSGSAITAMTTVALGTGPYSVEYFSNSGPGNTVFLSLGSVTTAPFSLDLGALPAGTYNLYSVATDSAVPPATSISATNTFSVANALVVTLTAPADNATVDHNVSVTASATVGGGTAPYSVQFLLDNTPTGAPLTSEPFTQDLGPLGVGDHTVLASVTDARGWVSNSVLHTVHVTGPLAVHVLPTNGTSLNFGQPVSITAVVGGGNGPYAVTIYTNDQPAGTLTNAPFTLDLGVLAAGSYSVYALANDSSVPAPQQSNSGTNSLTITPNPLVATLTAPTSGQTITAGAAFALGATATVGAPLTVSGVEFFVDGTSVGTDTLSPYTGSYANPVVGTHAVYAAATDSLGRRSNTATNQLTVNPATSGPPPNDSFANAITLIGPILTIHASNVGATKQFPGEPFIGNNFGGASVWWSWTASASGPTTIDTQGSDFNTLLGVYTGNAVNQLTAVAVNDNFEGNTWSRVAFDAVAGTTYRIVVDGFAAGGGFPPRPATGNIVLNIHGVGGLTIDTPTNGMVFTIGDPVPMSVTITPDFPNPPATRVEFYENGSLFSTVSSAPYNAVATNSPAGSNTFYVIAYDNNGAPVQSSVVTVFVQTIGVTLLTPADGTTFLSTNPITVTAHGFLPTGSITNITFLVDGQSFGEDSSAPYSAVWSTVTGGSHRITAVGRSDAGVAYNSQPVNIAVAQILVHSNAVWKYLDDGSDQGTAWVAPGFDDSTWASGPAELGYGDGDEATIVHSGPTNNYYITTYFRREFEASHLSALTNLNFFLAYDDAAVVYLNGTEIYRTANLPAGPISATNFATGAAIEETVNVFTSGTTNLVEGRNVLAVEIHQQALTSSDISFFLQVVGVPVIIRNESPIVALTQPASGAFFVAPGSITIEGTASDNDGSVTNVAFFADGVKIGETTNLPPSVVWNTPPVGLHLLTAVAADDQGATTTSSEVPIVVYDAAGTPVTHITAPADGDVMEGPTNLLVTATANAIAGVTNVQFLANGVSFADSTTAPYSALWNAPFGTNFLTSVVSDAAGVTGTSVAVRVVITIPPTNFVGPTIARQVPAAFATVTNLTNIVITFSERVHGVDASDLLINGIAATRVTGSGSNYTFSFTQPAYGEVEIAWAADHGILDFGYPSDLPFSELDPASQWEYELVDKTPPTITAHTPGTGVTVTNLGQVSVTFSEPVNGVDAGDLLVNGVASAFSVSGSDQTYTWVISQPNSGTVAISWATNHGITDRAEQPNAFLATGPGATWNFTLDARTSLVESNSTWKFIKGFSEASVPVDAWRQPGFNDSGWSNAPAPFFFGDPYTNATITGTLLSDMLSNYTCIFLRREFTVRNRGIITDLFLNSQSDDGYIAWLNGVEVFRYNMPAGEIPFDGTASSAAPEAFSGGANYINNRLTNALSYLVNGTNMLAVQAFNQSLSASTDFGFNAQLFAFITDVSTVAPRVVQASPPPGDLLALTNVTITFSESVSGVDASDLLVNGVPATGLTNESDSVYTFSFTQPAFGPVQMSWAADDGIVDLDEPPKPFDGTAASAILNYTLVDPAKPRVVSQVPAAGSTLTNLTLITVNFTRPVTGVNPSDLLINGVATATRVTGGGSAWRFSIPSPPFGNVAVTWATNHGIHDTNVPPNDFDPSKFGGTWTYRLVDPAPSVALTSPTNGTYVVGPANVTLRATASDNDGTISRVEFYVDANKLGEGTNAPYTFSWTNVDLGTYLLQAIATDNLGYRGTSAPVVLNVVTSLPAALVRGPYLQVGSPTGGVVRWRTDLPSDSIVSYGTDAAALSQVIAIPGQTNEHIVALNGLLPDTKYYYSIGSSARTLASGTNYWFKTSPPVGTDRPTRLWVLGDSGTANDNARNVRNAFYNYSATNKPADLWLMLGDNAYNSGLDTEYQTAVFDMYPATLRNLFLWPTIGNHETAQAFDIADFPYLHIFTLPQQGEAGGVPSGTPRYYSFDYANIHFVCLDSMSSGRSSTNAMCQWLRNDLAATTQNWVIAFFHHPAYTKGNHDSDRETELIEVRGNILPILEANGVDLVFTGHSHAWERSYFLNGHYGLSSTLTAAMKIDGGDGREDGTGTYKKNALGQGVVYTVAGNSGQITGGSLDHAANFLSLNELGSMVVDVSSNRIDVVMLATNGVFRDHYTVQKRVPQPVPAAPANLLAHAVNPTTIALSWDDMATNELSFIVERSLDGTNFTSIATNAADATTSSDIGLLANTTYYYRIHAAGTDGDSDMSNVASATTATAGGGPAAPTDLVVSSSTAVEHYRSQMILRWHDRSANEAGFIIERSDGGAFAPVGTVGANVTLYIDRGLASATTYFYRVRSSNASGDSAPSNVDADQTHPQSDLVAVGETAIFHAGIEGIGLIQYQWRYMDAAIFGETNETLVIPSAQFTDEGAYSVAVTDATGRTVSNPAWLYVLAPPSIVEQPASRTTVAGASVTFRVTADGSDPLEYQWRRNGASLPGANGPELVLTAVTAAAQGDYDVVVGNEVGTVTSAIAHLVVNTPPVARPDLVYRTRGENLAIDMSDLLQNDEDPDAEAITLTGVSATSSHGATMTTNGRYVFYTPPASFNEDDTFNYTITDARGAVGTGVVTVSVTDNNAPALAAIPDLIANVLTPLVITNVASDRDASNRLTMALEAGAPANARFNPRTGVLQWTPTRQQAPGTNRFTVRVSDDGRPSLTTRSSFTVYVKDYVELTTGSAVVNAGDPASLDLDVFSSTPLAGLQGVVHFDGDRMNNLSVESLQPELATATLQPATGRTALLTITALAGHSLQGTQHLAQLHFNTVPDQDSTFVWVTMTGLAGTRSVAGLAPTPLVNPGRVAILDGQPLLEAGAGPAGGPRQLKLFGKPGQAYTVERSTRPADPTSWVIVRSLTMSASQQSFEDSEGGALPTVFYRAKQ